MTRERRGVTVRMAGPPPRADRERVAAFLEARGMRQVARLGELVDPLDHELLLAEAPEGSLAGVLTWRADGPNAEVSTLYAAAPGRGIGTALLDAVARAARAAGCSRLWLITTNDNVDALRFYQRRGFRLVALHPGAVDAARATLKPSISEVGDHGIPIRDELVLEREL